MPRIEENLNPLISPYLSLVSLLVPKVQSGLFCSVVSDRAILGIVDISCPKTLQSEMHTK